MTCGWGTLSTVVPRHNRVPCEGVKGTKDDKGDKGDKGTKGTKSTKGGIGGKGTEDAKGAKGARIAKYVRVPRVLPFIRVKRVYSDIQLTNCSNSQIRAPRHKNRLKNTVENLVRRRPL